MPEAVRVIRQLAAHSLNVAAVHHARLRMRQRGVSMQDVVRVLQRGAITEGPFVSGAGNWRMNVTGRSAGEELTVVVEIVWRSNLLVVTVLN